jgi:hypothetical protein
MQFAILDVYNKGKYQDFGGFVDGNFIHLLDITRSSCEKMQLSALW